MLMMQNPIKQGNQLCLPSAAESTLKYRKLKPFTVAVHEFEDSTPTLLIGDVVRDDVDMFIH